MRRFFLGAATVLLCASVSFADFSADYDHSLWEFEDNGGFGSATTDSSTLMLEGNDVFGSVLTLYSIKVPGDGTISFDWNYFCIDAPRFDTAGYIVDGRFTLLTDTSGAFGPRFVPVSEGQVFSFFVDTSDGQNGAGVLTISNFSGPVATNPPTGACCFIQPGCIGDMSEAECVRWGGDYGGDASTCGSIACGSNPPVAELSFNGPGIDICTLPGSFSSYPSMTFNTQANEYLVTWDEGSLAMNTSIVAQRLDTAGNLVGPPATIILPESYQITPETAYNATDDEYLITWRWQGSGFNSLNAQRFNADLSPKDVVFQATANGAGFEASVVHNPNNNEYFALARRFSPTPGGIYGSRILGNTMLQSLVYDIERGINFSWPAPTGDMVYNSWDDQYLATYAIQQVPTWACYNLRGVVINPDGSTTGNPFQISSWPHNRPFYRAAAAAFDSNAGRYLVVYGDANPKPIHGQFLNRDGSPMGFPFEITAPMTSTNISPRMAFDPINNVYAVVWCESSEMDPTNIYAQLIAADGNLLGGPLLVSSNGYHTPNIQTNLADGGFLIAWRDSISTGQGTPDIYGQLLNVEAGCSTCGDMNCDGVVNMADLAPFAQALVDPAGYQTAFPACDIARADMNNDGNGDGADLDGFISKLLNP